MFRKLTDKIFVTPKGIIDLDAKPELTPAQRFSNARFDFEVAEAEREYQHREKMGRLRNEWYRKTHGEDAFGANTYGLNVIGRRRVIGIYYV